MHAFPNEGDSIELRRGIDQKVVRGQILTVEKARNATEHERALSVKEAFRLYRPAIGWLFLFSLWSLWPASILSWSAL